MYQAAEALQFLEADRLKEMVENLKNSRIASENILFSLFFWYH